MTDVTKNYIKYMRQSIGTDTLLTVGCGAIIVDNRNRILLQRRKDFGDWGVPGGMMELGESFEVAMKREVYEETNLEVLKASLFGLYSGEKCFAEYPNGDKIYGVQVIFQVDEFSGDIINDSTEGYELVFFEKENIPTELNPRQAPYILDWKKGVDSVIID